MFGNISARLSWRGLLLSLCLLPAAQAFGAYSCTATPSNTGGTFFQLDLSVTNTGTTALSGCTVTLNFPEQVTVTNAWNAGWTPGTGTSFQFTNCCGWQLPAPGATASNVVGVQGNHDGSFMAPACVGDGGASSSSSSSTSSSSSS